MKQTKSALTMLLNAYRAVYKSAYFKGLASAVVLTAGLAAGAAQAGTVLSGGSSIPSDVTTIQIKLQVKLVLMVPQASISGYSSKVEMDQP